MKRNLLIVEDDPDIRRLLIIYFRDEDFNILEAETGEDAIRIFKKEKVDIVILDIMLPELDGLRVCEVLRETSDVPVIMLTAKSQEEDKLRGFEYGADEYVTKPFSPKVLVARAHAMMNRTEGRVGKAGNVFEKDGLSLNFSMGKVAVDGRMVDLTRKEYDLLVLLIQNEEVIVSKEIMLDKIWGFDYDGDPRVVDTLVKRLRKKLGDKSTCIRTARGRGYVYE